MSDVREHPGTIANAVFRLATNAKRSPELRKAETQARLKLAAAIILMDENQDVPGRHNLNEQTAVTDALNDYGNALAGLIRNEEPPL